VFEVRRNISSDGENRNKVEEMLASFHVSSKKITTHS
jgi:hypothetical protein